MTEKDDEQIKWMHKHCSACKHNENTCISPFGELMGENGCWVGKGYKKVFCPYHVWSAQRFRLMKERQYYNAAMQELKNENPIDMELV